jgi:acyl-coenzyme A thioesterase PaaI-like protein
VDPTRLDMRDTIMEAVGIEVTELSAERVVATMPVHGPTLP